MFNCSTNCLSELTTALSFSINGEIMKAFSLPYGFRVTVELELNILQQFSGMDIPTEQYK